MNHAHAEAVKNSKTAAVGRGKYNSPSFANYHLHLSFWAGCLQKSFVIKYDTSEESL